MEQNKEDLKRRYDYSRYAVFKALDSGRLDSVSKADVRSFINKAGGYASFSDADAIFRRLDTDDDDRLNYSEISDFLDSLPVRGPSAGASRNESLAQSQNDWRSKSVGRAAPMSSSLYANAAPLRSSSPAKKQEAGDDLGASARKSTHWGTPSPNKQQEQASPQKEGLEPRKLDMDELDEASPEKEEAAAPAEEQVEAKEEEAQKEEPATEQPEAKAEEESKAEPEQKEEEEPYVDTDKEKEAEASASPAPAQASPSRSLSSGEDFDLFWTLKRFVELENDTERAKQDLALRYDFNHFDAFRVADEAGRGEIYRFELTDTLRKRGVYADRAEIELFYKRFDRNQDGKLRFSEWADAFTPLDLHAAGAVNRRQGNYRDPRPFSSLTTGMYDDTIRKILRNLGAQNDLNKRNRLSISAAFERIDRDNNGFITKDELRRFFDDHRHYATYRDLDLLVARFDKTRDGRITYSEFFDGLMSL